jgi:hypothetical protein
VQSHPPDRDGRPHVVVPNRWRDRRERYTDSGPYAEALLRPGEVLPAADAYHEHVGGRFRFRGAGGAEAEHALAATAPAFRVSADPVEQAYPLRQSEVTR